MKKSGKNHDTEEYASKELEVILAKAKENGMCPECFLLDFAAFCIMNIAENTGNSASATAHAVANNYNELVLKGWTTAETETKH